MPTVSVLLVVRNGQATIVQAVHSIFWQSMTDWELIVIDDGSSDGTVSLLRNMTDSRVRLLVDGQRRGLAARLNEGIEYAHGAFIARMDADDIALPDRLARQVSFLLEHPTIDVVGGPALIVDDQLLLQGVRRLPLRHDSIVHMPLGPVALMHPTITARRAWYHQHRYDPRLLGAEDHELFVRAAPESQYANLPEVVLAYRETAPRLAKLWRNRSYTIRGQVALAAKRRALTSVVRPIIGQVLRLAVELLFITLRQQERLAARRRGPATQEESASWLELRSQLPVSGANREHSNQRLGTS